MSSYYERLRQRTFRKIKRRGMAALLTRSGTRRACYVLEDYYSPRQIDGHTILSTDRRFLMAALTDSGVLDPAPSAEFGDVLIVADPLEESVTEELIMASPPAPLAPGGIVLYWDIHCRNR